MINLVSLLNTAIENTLPYSPLTEQKLNSMESSSMKWVVDELGVTVVFLVENGKFLVCDRHQATQVTLKASILELLKLLVQDGDMVLGNIEVEGNPLVLKQFSELFKSLDIDVEQIISGITGDFSAHQLGKVVRSFKQQLHGSISRLKDDWTAYKQDENKN